MERKLWIIYKSGIGFSKMIAEMLEDHLGEFLETTAGNASQIDPYYLNDGNLYHLIIGDTFSKQFPSLEIEKWVFNYLKITKDKNPYMKSISGYYLTSDDIKIRPSWVESIKQNKKSEIICPPILCLKLKKTEIELEDGVYTKIKKYAKDFIEKFLKIEGE